MFFVLALDLFRNLIPPSFWSFCRNAAASEPSHTYGYVRNLPPCISTKILKNLTKAGFGTGLLGGYFVFVDGQLRTKTYVSIMIIIASSVHVMLGAYFLYYGIPLMVLFSAVDVAIYAVTFFINRSGRVRVASFILVIKVAFFAVLSTFLFGVNVNAQWVFVAAALPAALHLDFTTRQRIWIISILAVALNVMLAFPFIVETPPLYMPDNTVLPFFFGNVASLSFIASIAGNAIITRRITEMQNKKIREHEEASYTDPLTKLSNRRYAEVFFNEINSKYIERPITFALLDVDNFKKINDTKGHEAGDSALVAVSDVLRLNTRNNDLVCRWGGEEFLLVLPGCEQEHAQRILEKIRKDVEGLSIQTETEEIKITVTGGGVLLVGKEIKAALLACDKNLYKGKRNGKNQIVF